MAAYHTSAVPRGGMLSWRCGKGPQIPRTASSKMRFGPYNSAPGLDGPGYDAPFV